jgi:hypothetical protein
MLKISKIRLREYNKSCSIFYNESNKIEFHFSEFSTIFYAFYKFQQFANTIGDTVLRWGPGKKWGLAMWPSGMAAGGSGQIPVAPAAVSTGEGGEKG